MKKFTFIELLVVVAIIGILVSILMPALRNAREAGRIAVCLSNNKQCSLAGIQYASHNGVFWGITMPTGPRWKNWYSVGSFGWAKTLGPVNDYLGLENGLAVSKCPSDTFYSQGSDTPAYDVYGTSYFDNMADESPKRRGGIGYKSLWGIAPSRIIEPSRCIMFMEEPLLRETYDRANPFNDYWHRKKDRMTLAKTDGSAQLQYVPHTIGYQTKEWTLHYDSSER